MVEMSETANILHNATANSLVLMDEVGRGTSTFDGLSLAWAAATHLAKDSQAFTLFATHYFELTTLAEEHQTIFNVHLDAMEHNEKIIFLHAVKDGLQIKVMVYKLLRWQVFRTVLFNKQNKSYSN